MRYFSAALACTCLAPDAYAATIVCPWGDGLLSLAFSADRAEVTLLHNWDTESKTLPVTILKWSVNPNEEKRSLKRRRRTLQRIC